MNEPKTNTVAMRHALSGVIPLARTAVRHAFTVLSFQIAGELCVEQGGPLVIRSGDMYVIPAGHAHRFIRAIGAEIWSVRIAAGTLDSGRFGAVLAPIESMAGGAPPRVAIPTARRDFVASLFGELADTQSGSPLRTESLIALLLGEMTAHAPLIAHDRGQSVDLAARAVSLIARRALGPLSLEDVAKAVGRHRSHVAEVVRRSTGRTVGELIAEVRLDEAHRRLQETDELVEVIGERVGYPDATHFSRMFKRRYGASPNAWRRNRLRIGDPLR